MATYQDKLNRIIGVLQSRVGFSNIVQGTKIYQLAEAIAYEQMLLEEEVETFSRQNSIVSGKGQELDDIANRAFGIKRLPEVKTFITSSMKALKFYSSSGTFGDINFTTVAGIQTPADIIIPEGTIISGTLNNTIYKFRTTRPYTLPKNANEFFVSAEIVQGDFNSIPKDTLINHNFTLYSKATNKLLKVTNSVPINTGRTKESDDSFRYRISNALRSFAITTIPAIHQRVTELPGVSNAFIENASNGGGTFTVYVQGTTPITSDDVIESVKLSLSQVISPWNIAYNVVKPFYIGIACEIKLTMKDTYTAEIGDLVASRISDLVNNHFGERFYLNNILQIAQSSHPDIMTASFSMLRYFTGQDELRSYSEIDLTANQNPVIQISNNEKIIMEPILNAVSVTV